MRSPPGVSKSLHSIAVLWCCTFLLRSLLYLTHHLLISIIFSIAKLKKNISNKMQNICFLRKFSVSILQPKGIDTKLLISIKKNCEMNSLGTKFFEISQLMPH